MWLAWLRATPILEPFQNVFYYIFSWNFMKHAAHAQRASLYSTLTFQTCVPWPWDKHALKFDCHPSLFNCDLQLEFCSKVLLNWALQRCFYKWICLDPPRKSLIPSFAVGVALQSIPTYSWFSKDSIHIPPAFHFLGCAHVGFVLTKTRAWFQLQLS